MSGKLHALVENSFKPRRSEQEAGEAEAGSREAVPKASDIKIQRNKSELWKGQLDREAWKQSAHLWETPLKMEVNECGFDGG